MFVSIFFCYVEILSFAISRPLERLLLLQHCSPEVEVLEYLFFIHSKRKAEFYSALLSDSQVILLPFSLSVCLLGK